MELIHTPVHPSSMFYFMAGSKYFYNIISVCVYVTCKTTLDVRGMLNSRH